MTDSYRLGRVGRVRTDLGGLHFNALTVLVLAAAYVSTGSGVLLLTALVLQFQMLQQLIPVVRFDGYYVLSDLAGVPDLFARVGPVLRSLRPGHPVDPRVTELRPRSRRFVTGWVVVVVPLLVAALAWAIWYLPEFVERGRDGRPAAAAGLRPRLGATRLGGHGAGGGLDRPPAAADPRRRAGAVAGRDEPGPAGPDQARGARAGVVRAERRCPTRHGSSPRPTSPTR